ncbi:MAG: hypothetical protein H7X70_01520 [Candidatus Kapabacteria bacterium]|nr:hypothetical protein [Candidatus Kapabacteria bacterium]
MPSQLLQPGESYVFTRVGTKSVFGANAIYVCDSTILVASHQDFLRSKDHGKTWEPVSEPLSFRNIVSVVPRGDTIYANAVNGSVYRTTNHGLTWGNYKRSNPPDSITAAAQMVSSTPTCTAALSESTLSLTFWTGATKHLTSDAFASASAITSTESTVYIARRREGILRVSLLTDLLDTVTLTYLAGEYITALAVRDSHLYAGTKLGKGGVHRCPIPGTGWERVYADRDNGIIEITGFTNSDRGLYASTREHGVFFIAPLATRMLTISDGLVHGMTQSITPLDSLLVIGCRAQGVFTIAGCNGELQVLNAALPPSFSYISGSLGTSVVVGLGSGTILRSDINKTSLDTISSPFTRSSLNSFASMNNELYVATDNGAWRTADTGRSWQNIAPELSTTNIQRIIPHKSVTIIIASSNTFFVYKDGSVVPFNPKIETKYKSRLGDAVFVGNRIYAAGYPGLFISDDFGRSWIIHTIEKVQVLRTLTVANRKIYVTSDTGQLLSCPLP